MRERGEPRIFFELGVWLLCSHLLFKFGCPLKYFVMYLETQLEIGYILILYERKMVQISSFHDHFSNNMFVQFGCFFESKAIITQNWRLIITKPCIKHKYIVYSLISVWLIDCSLLFWVGDHLTQKLAFLSATNNCPFPYFKWMAMEIPLYLCTKLPTSPPPPLAPLSNPSHPSDFKKLQINLAHLPPLLLLLNLDFIKTENTGLP